MVKEMTEILYSKHYQKRVATGVALHSSSNSKMNSGTLTNEILKHPENKTEAFLYGLLRNCKLILVLMNNIFN